MAMAGRLQKIYLFFLRGEKIYFLMRWGLLLKERICSHGEQILSFNSNPQIRSDTVSTIKLKNKNDFVLDLSEGMANCKMSGKSQGIWRWMISGNPG